MNWYSNPQITGPVAAAAVAAIFGVGVGLIATGAEDRKADAEFAKLALSILSVDEEEQNPVALTVAMRILAEVLPVSVSDDEQAQWLSGPAVSYIWFNVEEKYIPLVPVVECLDC